MKFTKKQVTIDAIQFTKENWEDIVNFTNGTAHSFADGANTCIIPTLEGEHIATEGDWIIKGIKGEFYPCKPDIFELTYDAEPEKSSKTLINTEASGAKENVKDIKFWGDGDTFKLISKASSVSEGWMKSTKAMQIDGLGCVLQVTTQQNDNVAEAVTFIPNVVIEENKENGVVVSRKLKLI
jgi:hypothetical protein